MTWSVADVAWTGWRFEDLWTVALEPLARPGITHVRFCGMDGYEACVPLEELFRPGVLIARDMSGQPLSASQGAPYRLVIPQLYGYKSVKHLHRIVLATRPMPSRFEPWIMHPRGRVDLEERTGFGSQRLWRVMLQASADRALRQAGWGTPRWHRRDDQPLIQIR